MPHTYMRYTLLVGKAFLVPESVSFRVSFGSAYLGSTAGIATVGQERIDLS